MVIAVLIALWIGVPIDLVSLLVTMKSMILTINGGTSMANCNDTVVVGAHGAAKSILRNRRSN